MDGRALIHVKRNEWADLPHHHRVPTHRLQLRFGSGFQTQGWEVDLCSWLNERSRGVIAGSLKKHIDPHCLRSLRTAAGNCGGLSDILLAWLSRPFGGLSHPGDMPDQDRPMSTESEIEERSQLYQQAKGWLVAAAAGNILDHCSAEDRARMLLSAAEEFQGNDVFIPELNDQTSHETDLIVQQAIATIAVLLAKNYSIKISKEDN
jgi:hypothetical protein